VDDEEIQLELAKMSLEEADPSFEVTAVQTPQEALRLVPSSPFDCIVSDFVMPGMNGVEFCHEVKSQYSTPLIIYTGKGSEEVAEAAFKAGADDYMMKEKSLAHFLVLARRIRHLVERRRAEEALGEARQREDYTQPELRRSGLEQVGDFQWGTHFCQFYRTGQDLIDILVPYFRAGLEDGEFCMWVTAEPLEKGHAEAAMREAVSGFDDFMAHGQIEILSYKDWYLRRGVFDARVVLDGWLEKMKAAISKGWSGLRLSGNTFWLEPERWDAFTDYERMVEDAISKHNMIALCTYSLEKCGAEEIVDVIKNHQFALLKEAGKWGRIESSESRRMEGALHASEERFHALFQTMTEAFVLCKVITDDQGKPVDFLYIDVNPAYEAHVGIPSSEVEGKTVREVIPGIEAYWTETLGNVGLTGKPATIENYLASLGRWFEVRAYSPERGYFVAIFKDVTERKRTEETLRESEKRMSKAQEIAHLGSWELDVRANRLTWSNEVYRIFGLEPREFGATYETFLDAVHPDDRAAVDAAYQGSLREGRNSYEIEHRVVRKQTGEVRFVHEKCEHTRDESGEVIRSIGMVHDITEWKLAEDSLRAEKDYSENVINSLPGVFYMFDASGRFLRWNRNFEAVTGYSGNELGKMSPVDFFEGPDKDLITEWVMEVFDKGESVAEAHFVSKSGKRIPYLFTGLRVKVGGRICLIGFGIDITERKMAEEKLREREEQLSIILSGSPIPMFVVDTDYRVTQVNPSVELLTGRKSKNLVGLRPGEAIRCFHSLDDPVGCGFGPNCNTCKVRGSIRETLNKRTKIHQAEAELQLQQGKGKRELSVLVSTVPLSLSGKAQVLVCLEDVTTLRQREAELEKTHSELQASHEELQASAEELEAANEELRKTNEELAAVEEELRASNEDMGRLNMELDATNEELKASQEELQRYATSLEERVAERTLEINEAKERIEASALYTRNLIEASLDPLVTINAEGKITDVNEATMRATGVTRRRMIGSDFSSYFTDPELARAGYLQVFSKGLVKDYPLTIRHRSGSTMDVLYNASVYRDEAGKAQGVFAVARDITQRKLAQERILAAQHYTRSLIEASLDPLVTISAKGKITDVNEATVQATGVSREELVGSEFADYFTEPDRAREGRNLVLAEGYVRDFPLTLRHKSGSTMDVLYNATLYKDPSGKVAGIFAAARDVTEKKRLEAKLLQAERMEAVSKITAMIAHDLRNPLNSIAQAAEMARTRPDRAERMLQLIEDSANRSLKMVEELRAGTREITAKPEETDLASLVKKLADENPPPKGVKMRMELEEGLRRVVLDAELIHRVLENIVRNGYEAMPGGGELTISAAIEGDQLSISVSDTGQGIPPDVAPKIFDAFYTTKTKGLGLGLAFSKRAVEAHGGSIGFISARGKGTTFKVTLPRGKKE